MATGSVAWTIKSENFSVITGNFGEAMLDNTKVIVRVVCNNSSVTGLLYSNGIVAFRTITTLEPVANQTVSGTYYYC
jgi:hypothetical protein